MSRFSLRDVTKPALERAEQLANERDGDEGDLMPPNIADEPHPKGDDNIDEELIAAALALQQGSKLEQASMSGDAKGEKEVVEVDSDFERPPSTPSSANKKRTRRKTTKVGAACVSAFPCL
jgi:hypothetical protein